MVELKLNAKCEGCKKDSITYDGKCVECLDPKNKDQVIGRHVIRKMVTDIAEMVIVHTGDILEAYNNADKNLSIAITVRLVDSSDDGMGLKTGMSFSTGKISDSRSCTIDEKQGLLFED